MEQPAFKLKEIIWEICGHCRVGCSFCGSKDIWKEEPDLVRIKNIAREIAKYPPESVDISGGDPLEVNFDTHKYITDLFRENKISPKIIVNPKSPYFTGSKETLNLYDWIGISINDVSDVRAIAESTLHELKQKIVAITNFNIMNIFEFEKIQAVVSANDLSWQIQFTVFKERDHALAIYNSESAIKYLFEQIEKALKKGIKIVVSDNMNANVCPAGKQTLGILHTGEAVACLSMRSWSQNIKDEIIGNVVVDGLDEIWENHLNKYRFSPYECCKDVCRRKAVVKYEPKPIYDIPVFDKENWGKIKLPPQQNPGPIVVYYGVWSQPYKWDPIVVAYAVTPVYGVQTWTDDLNVTTDTIITTTTSDTQLVFDFEGNNLKTPTQDD